MTSGRTNIPPVITMALFELHLREGQVAAPTAANLRFVFLGELDLIRRELETLLDGRPSPPLLPPGASGETADVEVLRQTLHEATAAGWPDAGLLAEATVGAWSAVRRVRQRIEELQHSLLARAVRDGA